MPMITNFSVLNRTLLAATLLFALLAGPGRFTSAADDLAEKGRAVFKQHQGAVVTVQVVLNNQISMSGRGGQANESRQTLTGTVVDPSGLTVLSLSTIDPASMMQNVLGNDEKF